MNLGGRAVLSRETHREQEGLAEAVRAACLNAALEAYEDASIRGVCGEGAWECAIGAIRSLDIGAVVERWNAEHAPHKEPK